MPGPTDILVAGYGSGSYCHSAHNAHSAVSKRQVSPLAEAREAFTIVSGEMCASGSLKGPLRRPPAALDPALVGVGEGPSSRQPRRLPMPPCPRFVRERSESDQRLPPATKRFTESAQPLKRRSAAISRNNRNQWLPRRSRRSERRPLSGISVRVLSERSASGSCRKPARSGPRTVPLR